MKLREVVVRIRHARPFAWLRLPTRRHRRMAVVALWIAFAAHVAVSALGGNGDAAGFLGFATLLAGVVCLFSLAEASVLRGGVRPLDVARLAARDRAYAAAFHGTGWLLLAVVVYAELALRLDALWLPSDPRAAVGAFAAVAVAIGLLPVSLLGWTEPDDGAARHPPPPAPPPPLQHRLRRDGGAALPPLRRPPAHDKTFVLRAPPLIFRSRAHRGHGGRRRGGLARAIRRSNAARATHCATTRC